VNGKSLGGDGDRLRWIGSCYVPPSLARMNIGAGPTLPIEPRQHPLLLGAQEKAATHVEPSASVAWIWQLPEVSGPVAWTLTKIAPPPSAGATVTEQGVSAVKVTIGDVRELWSMAAPPKLLAAQSAVQTELPQAPPINMTAVASAATCPNRNGIEILQVKTKSLDYMHGPAGIAPLRLNVPSLASPAVATVERHTRLFGGGLVPRRRGLRPQLFAAVVRLPRPLAFAAERQIVRPTGTRTCLPTQPRIQTP
jgi:hypothetical protein